MQENMKSDINKINMRLDKLAKYSKLDKLFVINDKFSVEDVLDIVKTEKNNFIRI